MPSNDKNTLAGYIPARNADALAGKVQGEPVFGVPGKSAYQLAVENGYEGTVEQWLASLQGPPGVPDPEQVTADVNAWLEKNPPNDGEDGGHYIPVITQPTDNTLKFDFTPSKEGMPAVKPAVVKLPAGNGSGGSVDYVVQDTPPEDKSVLWVDTSDNEEAEIVLDGYAKTEDIPTDAHINALINTALGVIENGSY